MPTPNTKTIPSLVIKRIIPAKRKDVFDAWTNPVVLKHWFIPPGAFTATTSIDLRVGGAWRHNMIETAPPAAGQEAGCKEHWGEYLEVKPPERLVFTWNTKVHGVRDTRVTVELKELGDETELTLTHELLEDTDVREGHNKGWTHCLNNLTAYLSK